MYIQRIQAENFKSFLALDVELAPFSILIGPNASGKSNFLEVFTFLKDVADDGLSVAASVHGGHRYLPNVTREHGDLIRLSVTTGNRRCQRGQEREGGEIVGISSYNATYDLAFRFKMRGVSNEVEVVSEGLEISLEWAEATGVSDESSTEETHLGTSRLSRTRESGDDGDTVRTHFSHPDIPELPLELLEDEGLFEGLKLPKDMTLLETPMLLPYTLFLGQRLLSGVGYYDFDPRLPKGAVPCRGGSELASDGANLALALREIQRSQEQRTRFHRVLRDLLPFATRIATRQLVDTSVTFMLREAYFGRKGRSFPAASLSDGTVNIAALIVALFFEDVHFAVFEEPERNLHPGLISRVLQMMRERSQDMQILVSTHNPELVRNSAVGELLLISRGEDGSSRVMRPVDNPRVAAFLANDVGLDELYVQNLLGE